MKLDQENLLNSILESLEEIDYVKPDSIPNIDLYMDQVTTFMEEHLERTKRYSEDKILTKTMINNYAKNNLLPPPVKKKYSKEHLLLLIFVYYFKNLLSIKDIEKLLGPLSDKHFSGVEDPDLQAIYEKICERQKERVSEVKESVRSSWEKSEGVFEGESEEEQRYLQQFLFICNLSFDVYLKKQIIEKLIDDLPGREDKKKNKK